MTELIVTNLSKKTDDMQYFLVYKHHLFILDDKSKLKRIKAALSTHPKYDTIADEDDVNNFVLYAAQSSPDIIAGIWNPKDKSMMVWDAQEVIPQTSLNVKKAAKQLGAEKVSYQYPTLDRDIGQTDLPQRKLIGGIPKIMYHGTASEQLRSILKFGLSPGKGPSRFAHRGVQHKDYIFLAATFRTCEFYAEHAVRISKKTYDNFPIIIELEVPNPDLLVPDYDADASTIDKPFYPYGTPKPKAAMKSMGISRETGKWGYKGRIPSSFIRWVYYYNTYQKKWHKSRPDVWRKLLQKYDWEQIGYKLGTMNFIQPEKNPYGSPIPYWQ